LIAAVTNLAEGWSEEFSKIKWFQRRSEFVLKCNSDLIIPKCVIIIERYESRDWSKFLYEFMVIRGHPAVKCSKKEDFGE
jgi:hypothetical protein